MLLTEEWLSLLMLLDPFVPEVLFAPLKVDRLALGGSAPSVGWSQGTAIGSCSSFPGPLVLLGKFCIYEKQQPSVDLRSRL